MTGVTLRGLAVRWWRAALTGLAAVVGVAVVSGTLMVGDTADRLGTADSDLDLVRQIMLIAGAVALLVGAFIVNVTMSVTVAQRARELALLRCLGATRRQVRRSVLLEALLIGVAAALAGLLGGFGVAALLRLLINSERFPGDLPGGTIALTPRTVAAALLVGCAATVLSALAPSRRASRLPPVAALREVPLAPRSAGAVRLVTGFVVAAGAGALVAAGIGTGLGPLLLAGAALALVAARLLGPWAAPALASLVGRPVAGVLRLPGALGRRNAARSPDRTAAIASALMVGVALLGLVTVLSASTRSGIVREYERYLADFEVRGGERGLAPEYVQRLEALPEVATAVPERCTGDAIGPGGWVCAVDPALLGEAFALDVVAGSLADLGPGRILVEEGDAAAHGWTVGSTVPVRLPGGSRTLTVAALHDSFYFLGQPLMVPADYAALGGDAAAGGVYLRAAAGVPEPAIRAAVQAAVTGDPQATVTGRAQERQRQLDQIEDATWVYRSLTGIAIVVGLFGVVNVLALSIVERRRELGMLRAVGMQRRQVRAMVRAEAVITATVGVLAGLLLGVLFGWAAARVLANGAQPIRFTLPAGPLVLIAVLAGAAAVAAATLPARWAARIDVLRAIAAAE
jgi:putative ABC transport system permease protein